MVAQAQFLYTNNADSTITVTGYDGPGGAVTIPSTLNGSSVVRIGDDAFAGNQRLTSVTLPNSVTSLGDTAFASCGSLTNATIPYGVTNLGNYAFFSCTGLTSVTIPDSVFSTGFGTFGECAGLTSVTLPRNLTSIDPAAFDDCTNLMAVTIGNCVTNIGDEAFRDCSGLTNLVIGNSVTTIGERAFAGCYGLTSVTIPGSLTNIVANYHPGGGPSEGRFFHGSFVWCYNLTNFTIDPLNPAFSSLDGVLLNKSQDTIIQFPPGKTGGYKVPNSVSQIADGAFAGCAALESVTIPSGLTGIGAAGFIGCTGLKSVFSTGNAPSVGGFDVDVAFLWATNATVYYLPGTIGWDSTFGGAPAVLWNPTIQLPVPADSPTNGFGFEIAGTPNIPFAIETSSSLNEGDWDQLQSLTLTNGLVAFRDWGWSSFTSRFYRIRSP